MTEPQTPVESQKRQRMLSLFQSLLPMVDAVADKIRLFVILGLLAAVWLTVWCFHIKHYSIGISAAAGIIALLPVLILARFWWALEELKDLPAIAGEMLGDAKTELQASVQNLRAGNIPKLGIFSAGKSLWSIGSMTREIREIAGSYLSIATVANPFMLILGVFSLFGIFIAVLVGIILAFFAF